MEADRHAQLTALLNDTESAHGRYEATELEGVYDEAWPAWYGRYAVEHGLGEIIGHPVTAEEAGAFLERTYAEYGDADPKPDEPWAEYLARRMLEDLERRGS